MCFQVFDTVHLIEAALGPTNVCRGGVSFPVGVARCTFALLLLTVDVQKTKVGVKHHLLVFIIVNGLIDDLPLVLGGVTVHGELRSPSLGQKTFVVVVVEQAHVLGI